MKRFSLLASVSLVCGLGLAGCDKQPPADSPADSSAASKTPQAGQAATAAAPPAAHSGPGPANPHAAMPAQPKPSPLGPPRDVTPSGETRELVADGLVMTVPKEWESLEVDGNMRKASLIWPGPGGDVNLVVYRFPGGAGGIEQNIERWTGQVDVGEGPPAERVELEAQGLKVTGIDVRGKFGGQAMPGVPAVPAYDDARMFAVAIEGSGDPWYLKVVGPSPTVDLWAAGWTTMLGALKAAPTEPAPTEPGPTPAPAE